MDMNEFMKRMVEAGERTAAAMELMAKTSAKSAETAAKMAGMMQAGREVAVAVEHVAGDSKTPAGQAAAAEHAQMTNAVVRDTPEQAKANQEAAVEAIKSEVGVATGEAVTQPPVEQKKAPSADDCRNALKTYAAANGNPAAMALLQKFGATSVSTLEEGKRAGLIEACK